ncbi:hypothetical protein [Sphingosinicella sp. BN140058]|uniref:hypothetical protein n=1 Tax=Sphingosinicella sp. BN140058 TaxID=1892855 RepID=UPI0010133342|nr:hypothetical protein [Sphingosinicella sp. BN140058]QAY76913.1 hypothetical protein ETR14_10710 [Sphingosinicella sp. BN140058]
MEYSPGDDLAAARPRRRIVQLLIGLLLAFLAGVAAMAWLLSRWNEGAAMLGIVPPAPVVADRPVQQAPQPAAPVLAPLQPGQMAGDPETSLRVARLEQRVSQLDVQSRAAVGNADRAEGLLVAFAARRALDRGVALGYIEGLLQQRFAATQPQAVATIITASRDPITLQKLQEELRQVQPFLVSGGPDQSWWAAFQTELGSLVSIRKEGTQSTLASERLRRAISSLEGGQVEVALAEVTRLPGRDRAASWVAKARRYLGARRALDEIETAALLETRPAPQVIRQPRPQPTPAPPPARPAEPA